MCCWCFLCRRFIWVWMLRIRCVFVSCWSVRIRICLVGLCSVVSWKMLICGGWCG